MKIFEPHNSPCRLTVFTGNYGSGKTEVAVNFTLQIADEKEPVRIADLDIVNPYFRCREVTEFMQHRGVTVVAPPGGLRYADLPVILPEIKGMIESSTGRAILDVGGDPVGARVLSSLASSFSTDEIDVLVVLNANRPFTDTAERCLKMIEDIQQAARLKVTGIVGNTHLMDDTTWDVILEGEALLTQVASMSGLPIRFVTVDSRLLQQAAAPEPQAPVLRIERHMLPPWIEKAARAVQKQASNFSENRGILGGLSDEGEGPAR